ncbi:TPA: hypothetical protein LA460_000113 [Clostridium botulinum]|nr:hypothetical protein [Clostridium botulinum]HBJ1652718.1 hypothetical protein [Clostridium botulinum]
MSREIKFRAFNLMRNKMIYNIQDEFEEHITLGMDCFGNYLKDDDFTVMQYTGIKDKNGKEIYEGDILKLSNSRYKVIYQDCSFQLSRINGYDLDLITMYAINKSEVIGNIYENKELLKDLF